MQGLDRWAAGAVLGEAPRLAADALKAKAVAVHERHKDIPGLQMVGLVHNEVLLLAPEEHPEKVGPVEFRATLVAAFSRPDWTEARSGSSTRRERNRRRSSCRVPAHPSKRP